VEPCKKGGKKTLPEYVNVGALKPGDRVIRYVTQEASSTPPPDHGRSCNYVYSPNRLLNFLFDGCKKKVEFLAAA